jgi:hypothetical protein
MLRLRIFIFGWATGTTIKHLSQMRRASDHSAHQSGFVQAGGNGDAIAPKKIAGVGKVAIG